MEKKILVVGAGKTVLIGEQSDKEVLLISSDDSYAQTEKLIKHFTRVRDKELFEIGDNQFVCKGKHQYRETKGEWKCECGRNIND